MIEFTSQQLHENTQYIQNIAKNQAVLIENGDSKQVLLNYDDFVKLNQQKQSDKPFVSAYDVFTRKMSPELRQVLAQIEDEDLV